MENQNQGSDPSQPLDSPSHELQSPFPNEQTQKRNRPKSPSHVSAQPLKRSREAALAPPSFPQDIIAEILSTLPVKSLIRFRCVSKSWKDLVNDPFFVKKHLKNLKNSKKRMLIKTPNLKNGHCIFKSCSVTAIFENPIIHLKEIEYPLKDYSLGDRIVGPGDRIVGSCNGLICISTEHDNVFLINPILRAFKLLPDLGRRRRKGCYTLFGFGFDASMNDYKVVRVFCDPSVDLKSGFETIVRVYSLKTNCWRMIQSFPFGVPCRESGKFVDGCLNWSVKQKGDRWPPKIVSLDLAHETYKEVVQHCYDDSVGSVTIGVLDGCLCVVCNTMEYNAEVWVMKEYGKNESWSKLVVIPQMEFFNYEWSSAPIFVSVNGEILLDFNLNLFIYDPKEKMWRMPVIDNDDDSCIEQVVYEESLVSPNAVKQHG